MQLFERGSCDQPLAQLFDELYQFPGFLFLAQGFTSDHFLFCWKLKLKKKKKSWVFKFCFHNLPRTWNVK